MGAPLPSAGDGAPSSVDHLRRANQYRVIGNGYGGKYGLCTGGNNARVSVVS
jgi:hypothetical protein